MSAADEAMQKLEAFLHEPTHGLTAPDISEIISDTKSLTWLWPDLLIRLANQLERRIEHGNLSHDEGREVTPVATHAVAQLRIAALAIGDVADALEQAHNDISHLRDH